MKRGTFHRRRPLRNTLGSRGVDRLGNGRFPRRQFVDGVATGYSKYGGIHRGIQRRVKTGGALVEIGGIRPDMRFEDIF